MDFFPLPRLVIESEATFLIALHLAMAGATTVHALMNKRDVPATIGWIGLAWLSPIFGPLLYVAFGINRVRRRARRLRDTRPRLARHGAAGDLASVRAGQIDKALFKITGQRIAPGNFFEPLHSGDEGYPVMLKAIDEATTSVAMCSYIFHSDETGARFIDALARANDRGVAVRVLIDGFGGGFFLSRAYRRLRGLGVPCARFLHSTLPWKMPLLNLRLHKKILVTDGRLAFVGGLNIAKENTGKTPTEERIRDTHFRIRGSVVGQIAADFQNDWLFATGELLDGPDWFPENESVGHAQARVIASGPDQAVDQLVLVLLSAINGAHRSIRIATPYFLPDEQIVTALQLATMRGVDVRIVLPAESDHWLVACAARAHIGPLLESGCLFWRSPPPFDHSKLLSVDDEWCLIGSPNWDTRSLRLNFEIAIEIHDTGMAAAMAGIIDGKRGTPLVASDLDNRWFILKLRDSAVRLLMPYL